MARTLCLSALRDTGAKHETKTDELEVRAKQARRQRRPKLITTVPPPEAA